MLNLVIPEFPIITITLDPGTSILLYTSQSSSNANESISVSNFILLSHKRSFSQKKLTQLNPFSDLETCLTRFIIEKAKSLSSLIKSQTIRKAGSGISVNKSLIS